MNFLKGKNLFNRKAKALPYVSDGYSLFTECIEGPCGRSFYAHKGLHYFY